MKNYRNLLILFVLGILCMGANTANAEETAVPFSLNGYQPLLQEGFPVIKDYGPADFYVHNAAGATSYGWAEPWFADNSKYASTDYLKNIKTVSDEEHLTFMFQFRFDTYIDDIKWQLRDGKEPAVSIAIKGNSLYYEQKDGNDLLMIEDARSQTTSGTDYTFVRVDINQKTKLANVYCDDKLVKSDAPLYTDTNKADNVYYVTGREATGKFILRHIDVFKGYYVDERALEGKKSGNSKLTERIEWKNDGGKISSPNLMVVRTDYGDENGYYMESTKATKELSATMTFKECDDWMSFMYYFYQKEKQDGFVANFGNGVEISTSGGNFCYKNEAGNEVPFYTYAKGVIYDIRIDVNNITNRFDLYLNGVLRIANQPLAGTEKGYVQFKVLPGKECAAYFDNVRVYKRIPEPEDYVSAPQKVDSSKEVGMISCTLWTQGRQLGWKCISAFPDRKPYLGFYDGESIEVADWETKWMAEHGIDFRMYCWFGTNGTPTGDVGLPDLAEGFHYSKYKSNMKYCIMYENYSSNMKYGMDELENILIPAWIESYFKDPQYLKIDNKPVISVYSLDRFLVQLGGEDGVRKGVQLIKDKCKEAGFDGAYVMLCSMGIDASKYGFDATHVYHYGTSSGSAEVQKDAMETELANGSNFMPVAVQGWWDEPWNLKPGKFVSPEDYRDLLYWIRDYYQANLPNGNVGKDFVILDNWNEYGEGHFLAPTTLAGFQYLDAVREVFGDGSKSHTDEQPTDEQKSRFNVVYDTNLIAKKVELGSGGNLPQKVLAEWNFNGSTEGWKKNGGISEDFTVVDGAIKGVAVTADPSIVSPNNLDINIGEGAGVYIKIRMKNMTPASDLQIFFRTEDDFRWNETLSVKAMGAASMTDFEDFYVDMTTNSKWTGLLKDIRIDPASAKGEFYIDQVQVLAYDKLTKDGIVIDGSDKFIPPVKADGVPMIPFRGVMEACGMKVEWYSETGTGLASSTDGNNVIRVTENSDSLMRNDDKVIALDNPVANIDGTLYVPLDFVRKAMNCSVAYDDENNIVKISSNTLEYVFPQNHLEGWTLNENFSIPLASSEYLTMETKGMEAQILSPTNLKMPVSSISEIKLVFRNNTPARYARIYYTTLKDQTWNAEKSVVFPINPNDKELTEYTVNVPESWSGEIYSIKFVPTSEAGSIELKSIQFVM